MSWILSHIGMYQVCPTKIFIEGEADETQRNSRILWYCSLHGKLNWS